jgi:excisionase family DNA binding protein
MENLFSINTAAARLDCHPETVRRLIRRGDLQAAKVGKNWRVSEAALASYLSAHTVNATETKSQTSQ